MASHSVAPYIIEVTGVQPERDTLGAIASDYLKKLKEYLSNHHKTLNAPMGWDGNLLRNAENEDVDLMHWLHVWPPVGSDEIEKSPQIASWNLSRNPLHDLPATIVMVATEFLDGQGDIAQFTNGFTVPMLVEPIDDGFRVIIRSMTAEYPSLSQQSWSTVKELIEFPPTSHAGAY
ncbi:hypothetical protein GV827_14310 [Sulfitobacter sp. JBTF-M27]|uniref:Uncharacterized protein n=1 Tax=Sulfitobacter sediminilitoris TaxID=2698830 RepID=A0A6P0CBF3_9RHOB|nr:hypothetical protein [Sulfitobacter sediminilitoris]NEK23571.1 hypothetical protein [Sulfitobacter sediminilitoris]